MRYRILLLLALCLAPMLYAQDSDSSTINPLPEVPVSQLSDPGNTVLGMAALAVRANDWKHSETDHFILHFFRNFVAAQVAAELEFYYHVISTELHQDTSTWQRKSHVYIFDNNDDWHIFQKQAKLDPWTGGIHSEGNLYIVRNPAYKFGGRSLGHECAHLVIYRFFGAAVPLWLNEGYAENSSIRFYAGLERRRGYNAAPHSAVLTAANYIPVATLTSMAAYPDDVTQVSLFYQESEKLVGFLRAQDAEGFVAFLDAISHGSLFEPALDKAFPGRFQSIDDLNQQFLAFAQRQYQPVAGN